MAGDHWSPDLHSLADKWASWHLRSSEQSCGCPPGGGGDGGGSINSKWRGSASWMPFDDEVQDGVVRAITANLGGWTEFEPFNPWSPDGQKSS